MPMPRNNRKFWTRNMLPGGTIMDLLLRELTSEQQNEFTRNVDQKSTVEILRLINDEDRKVPEAVRAYIPQIAQAVDAIVGSFRKGGRLLYFGAGTSGRLGILDASECPPTYGTDPKLIVGVIAGGQEAIQHAVEGSEDDEALGGIDVDGQFVGSTDVVVGISASGRTPYVLGAMARARKLGATVVGIANNKNSEMGKLATIMIEVVVGPEVILGSTRMKAGTAQKLILNMLTTASLTMNGKVYDNLMVDMQSTNQKLVHRAKRLIEMATGAESAAIEQAYTEAGGHVKTAIVMLLAGICGAEAAKALSEANGFVRDAIKIVISNNV
jgi:N-acetylmuramic acid 6-phosphate etherase